MEILIRQTERIVVSSKICCESVFVISRTLFSYIERDDCYFGYFVTPVDYFHTTYEIHKLPFKLYDCILKTLAYFLN